MGNLTIALYVYMDVTEADAVTEPVFGPPCHLKHMNFMCLFLTCHDQITGLLHQVYQYDLSIIHRTMAVSLSQIVRQLNTS